MKNRASIFALLLLLFGCKDELPVQSPQTLAFNYTIHLFGVVNADTLFADSAQVAVDGKIAGIADSHGVFVTPLITPGEHELSVTHNWFSNYDSVCRFEQIHDFYLPLQLRQTLAFNYTIHLFGIVNADTLLADGAQVAIDGKSVGVADSHGVFIVRSITPGVHGLSVTHKLFSNYDTTCRFEEIHDIYLPLVVPLEDFFPLKVGATWVYRYDYTGGTYIPTGPTIAGTGTTTWSILSSQSYQDTIIFVCSELFHPDSASVPGLSSDTAYFSFIESPNHRITLAWSPPKTNLNFYWQLIDILRIYCILYRFQPSNGPDSLVFEDDYPPFGSNFTLTLRRGIGLYSYEGNNITGTYHERFYYMLETCTIR